MKDILHIIYIPFVGVGIGTPFRNDEWLMYRIKIFQEYTLKSLMNQTEKGFVLWLSFTENELNTKPIESLGRILQKSGLRFVFTFDGLMYWDDKFGGNAWEQTKNFLRIIRRCWRNKTFNEFFTLMREWRKNEKKNNTLKEGLFNSLVMLWKFTDGEKWVYFTRLDSDDLLHKDVAKIIQSIPPRFRGAITMRNGYVYDKENDRLAEWNPLTNPPFHTILFPVDVFFEAQRHLEYYDGFKSHEDIPRIFHATSIGDGLYCVLVHSREHQISTIWGHKFRGAIINNKEILRDFWI